MISFWETRSERLRRRQIWPNQWRRTGKLVSPQAQVAGVMETTARIFANHQRLSIVITVVIFGRNSTICSIDLSLIFHAMMVKQIRYHGS
jgi:hypothetical protein